MLYRFNYTTSTDFLFIFIRVISFFGIFVGVIAGSTYLIPAFDYLSEVTKLEYDSLSKTARFIIVAVYIIGVIFITSYIYAIVDDKIFRVLSSYIYVRAVLRTKISWKEADYVSFLFSQDYKGRWYPMKDVLKYPKEFRRKMIIDFAKEIKSKPFYY